MSQIIDIVSMNTGTATRYGQIRREVLAVKKPYNYRALWGRLPGAEAQALYILDMLGCLAYWRPGYIVNDILRVINSLNEPPARKDATPLGVRPIDAQPPTTIDELKAREGGTARELRLRRD
jgi:hypothetical protein